AHQLLPSGRLQLPRMVRADWSGVFGHIARKRFQWYPFSILFRDRKMLHLWMAFARQRFCRTCNAAPQDAILFAQMLMIWPLHVAYSLMGRSGGRANRSPTFRF